MTTLYQKAHSFEGGAIDALRNLDAVIVLIGIIPALVLGAPALGVIVGAAAWLLQRVAQLVDFRLAERLDDGFRRAAVKVTEAFGRIWLLAAAIVIAGVAGGRRDGLAAAVLIFVAYSIAFCVRLINGPPPAREPR